MVGGCGRFLGDDHAAVPWLWRYCTGLIQPSDRLMRPWSCQRMQSPTKASTSPRGRSSQCPGWTDSVFILPKNPSAAALSGERPFAPVDHIRPCRSMRSGHPGHRQWQAAVGMHQGPRPLRQRLRGLDEHPVGEPGVGTGTGGARDDPAVMAVDRRREARPSRPRP